MVLTAGPRRAAGPPGQALGLEAAGVGGFWGAGPLRCGALLSVFVLGGWPGGQKGWVALLRAPLSLSAGVVGVVLSWEVGAFAAAAQAAPFPFPFRGVVRCSLPVARPAVRFAGRLGLLRQGAFGVSSL